jgi:hypothetical protein
MFQIPRKECVVLLVSWGYFLYWERLYVLDFASSAVSDGVVITQLVWVYNSYGIIRQLTSPDIECCGHKLPDSEDTTGTCSYLIHVELWFMVSSHAQKKI